MHLQTTHTDVRTKQCTECSMYFKTTSQLNQHMVTHSGQRNHSCPMCGKMFVQRHNMLAHYRIHTSSGCENTSLKRHICHECNAVFSRPSHLQTHMRRKHSDADSNEKLMESHSPSIEFSMFWFLLLPFLSMKIWSKVDRLCDESIPATSGDTFASFICFDISDILYKIYSNCINTRAIHNWHLFSSFFIRLK